MIKRIIPMAAVAFLAACGGGGEGEAGVAQDTTAAGATIESTDAQVAPLPADSAAVMGAGDSATLNTTTPAGDSAAMAVPQGTVADSASPH